MKFFYLLFLLAPLTFVFANDANCIDTTADLIKQGNIHQLARNFSPTIELTIINDENTYSNAQAELILTNFFNHCQPKSVRILHRIESNPNFHFAVLMINTTNGVYRTSFSLKCSNGHFEINELRIESEKTN